MFNDAKWVPIAFVICFLIFIACLLFKYDGVKISSKEISIQKNDESFPELYFSPSGGCTDAIVRYLRESKKEVYIEAYSFTSKPIRDALVKTKIRGVNVVCIIDDGQLKEDDSIITALKTSGIEVYLDGKHAIFHNKVILIDGEYVLTGSFNFSKSAEEKNAENLLILKDKALVLQYKNNFDMHLGHSIKF